MKKIYLLSIVLLGMLTGLNAQPEINWGEEVKAKGDIKIVGNGSEDLFALRFHKKKIYFERYNLEKLRQDTSIEIDFLAPGSKSQLEYEASYIIDENVVILATFHDINPGKNILYSKTLDKTGHILKDWVELVKIEVSNKKNTGGFTSQVSLDKKTLLIFVFPPINNEGNKKYKVYLFDTDLRLKREREILLNHSDQNISFSTFKIDKLGNIYIKTTKSPLSKEEEEEKQKEKEDVHTHIITTYNLSEDKIEHIEYKLENKTVINSTLKLSDDGSLIVCGFYKDNLHKNPGLSGVYYFKYKIGNANPIVQSTREFEKDFIAELIGKKAAENDVEISVDFEIEDLIIHKDGGITIIAEQRYIERTCFTNSQTNATVCHLFYRHEDIMLVGIDPKGEILWNKHIHKYQTSPIPYYSFHSISCFILDDKIQILFNNLASNYYRDVIKQSTENLSRKQRNSTLAVSATVSQTGEIEFQELFYSKHLKYRLGTFSNVINVNERTYIGLAYGKRNKIKLLRLKY